MAYYLLTTCLVFVCFLTASAQFTEDFSDGDFTNGNMWSGDASEFIVNGSTQLQLNNPGMASTSYLSAPNALADLDSVEWQFYIRQSFSPSGSNNGRVYLVSDQANLTGSLNGYYVLFGEAGSGDAISIYEQTGTTSTLVCSGTVGAIASSFDVSVKVLRNHLGDWELWVDYTAGTNYVLDATGSDATHNVSSFIGVVCNYTSSNSTDFYFDTFYSGDYILDLSPPTVTSVVAISANDVDVYFDEPVDLVTSETVGNYAISGIGMPATASRDGSNLALVHLNFSSPFVGGNTYTLETENVEDLSGNAMSVSSDNFTYLVFATPGSRDVLINEIFPDPSPQVGLPAEEFVEIYNNTSNYFDLNGWQITDGTGTATMPSHILAPNAYLILCNITDTNLFQPYGDVLGLNGFPSLNNSGDDLELLDQLTNVLDAVSYDDSWYRDGVKEDGGYSLELINPTIPCADPSNWIGSFDVSGGTPGTQNSQADFNPDTSSPAIVNHYIHSSDSIKIEFSEALDATALGSLSLLFSNGLGFMESLDSDNPACLWVQTSTNLNPGESFTIDIAGLSDCSGNSMSATTLSFVVPELAAKGDILINEVLFNPTTGGQDFVELYNNSDKVISLEGWYLANWSDSIANLKEIEPTSAILDPGDFLVLTKDSSAVKTSYPLSASGVYLNMPSMPSYNNDSGTVYLLKNDSSVMDRFAYDEDMHFPLLNDVDGVSLERLDYNRESSDSDNWHSAAEAVGFATPGYENSQLQMSNGSMGDNVTLEPNMFSPDNDGFEDILNIHYEFDEAGFVATVMVFDGHGRLVRRLISNELLGTSGIFSWDGITDSREKAPIGTYVLYFEIFNVSGVVDKFKKPCVVAGKL